MNHGTRTLLTAAALLALLSACQRADTPADAGYGAAAEATSEQESAMMQADRDYQMALRRCDMLATAEKPACVEEAQSRLQAAREAAEGAPGPS